MRIASEPLTITRPRRHSDSVRSDFFFRHRGALGALALVPMGAAALVGEPAIREDSPTGQLLNAAGWLAFLTYATLRIWATLYVGGRKDRELQTEGPYSISRNPLYLGSLAFAVALACFLKNAAFALALLPAVLLYLHFVVRAEEHFLALRFGDAFRDYCARTPRLWPRWSALRTPPFVSVEMRRLKNEFIRLLRAALFVLALQALVHCRVAAWWPQWFHIV